jgi:transposase InsO family protein
MSTLSETHRRLRRLRRAVRRTSRQLVAVVGRRLHVQVSKTITRDDCTGVDIPEVAGEDDQEFRTAACCWETTAVDIS